MTGGRYPQPIRRQLYPNRVHAVLEKYIKQLGLGHGYSAYSMRATFITTALENAAKLEDVQRTVGHADPSTQLYDRRRFMPTKSAPLVVDYGTAGAPRATGGAEDQGVVHGTCILNRRRL
jgi:integrase/recombinase XerD